MNVSDVQIGSDPGMLSNPGEPADMTTAYVNRAGLTARSSETPQSVANESYSLECNVFV